MNSFRVVTFNMQYGQVWDAADPDNAPIDLKASAQVLLAQDADIIFLQEVERVQLDDMQAQPPPNYSRLKELLPGYHSVFSYPRYDDAELPFGFGQAIFSRTPVEEVERIDLPPPDLEFDFYGAPTRPTARLMLSATTQLAGRRVRLFNAHLQAFFIINHSSDAHRGQRDKVEAYLRDSELPTILGGDMNSAPRESLVQQFVQAGYQAAQTQQITWKRMPYVLDHLFYNRLLRVEACEVVPTDAADHELLRADFRFAD
ncbi:MAG: endonuclease/exonuclease/phosphatase family protein [Verrucomicrobiota bacterium JB022]|nr:endonuclease/exonuclease/phosphatase family protein [Verrucomicrobiota bacterium JB022]